MFSGADSRLHSKGMNVLVLTKYDTLAASARLRFAAYAPYLSERGIHLTLSPLFNNAYLRAKFASGRPPILPVVRGFMERIKQLLTLKNWDLVLLQYEIFPYLPAGVESILASSKVPYVVDYDDAIFHMYDDHSSWFVRSLLSDKIGKVMTGARAVIAGSQYLADYAQRYSSNVHLVPTVVDLERYRVKDWENRGDGPFTVGWIGSPSTAPYLNLIREALTQLGRRLPTRLLVIGASIDEIEGVRVETHPWSEATEVELLLQCDVGVMPLPDEKWARGKCAFKLIQYMACGLPVVASPVGENKVLVKQGRSGFLAQEPKEWSTAFDTLWKDIALRAQLGVKGRQQIEERYSLQFQSTRLLHILKDAQHEATQ